MRRNAARAALVVVLATWGCGDIETTGNDDNETPATPPGERPPVAEEFVEEPYGVGPSWYAYDSSNHTLTPHDRIYRFRRGDLDALVEVTSYYDDEGESGYFTLRSRLAADDGWGETRELALDENAKKQPVCVALEPFESRECDGSGADLVFRTDLRTVPAAGFAVSNPAIYATGHRADSESDARITQIRAEKITSLPSPLAGDPLVDARFAPALSAVGSPEHVHLQATGDMMLAQWQVTDVTDTEGALEATLRSRCVELANGRDNQTPLSDKETGTATISVPTDDAYAVALVDLCDRSIVDRSGTPYGGLWPASDSFDLFVEQVDGSLAIRVAPGHLIWDWTAGPGDGSTELQPVELPDDLWDQ